MHGGEYGATLSFSKHVEERLSRDIESRLDIRGWR